MTAGRPAPGPEAGAAPAEPRWTGRPERRVEDERLLTGAGRYVDDISLPGMLHLVAVRSPLAHARLAGVDVRAARSAPGVAAVVVHGDIAPLGQLPIMTENGVEARDVPIPVLASGRVRFAGEPVAAVIASSPAAAADAAELVVADYQELPAVTDPADALAGRVLLHDDVPGNVLYRWQRASPGVADAFARAARVIRARLELPRLAAAPMEPRGAVAVSDRGSGILTVYASAQDPHRPRLQLAAVLRRPPESIRVVVGDVGGAFGSKSFLAPEAFVAAVMAERLGAPVKAVETRSENFLAAYQGRGQLAECELAVDGRGRFLGLRARIIADVGAYLYPAGTVPPVLTGLLATGVYDIGAASVEVLGVATTKAPTGPYRGAGRPEAAYLYERMADLAAAELGLDRAEIRRRNLVPAAALPYRTPVGATVDSGDFPLLLRRACELLGYEREQARARAARARGEVRGVGLSVFCEMSGLGFWESAAVSVDPSGKVIAQIGSCPHGQGHQTAFAQVLADALGMDLAAVEIRYGDTAQVPPGVGTFASRSAIVGGAALAAAAEQLKAEAVARAARRLGVPPAQVSWRAGKLLGPDLAVGVADLAAGGRPLTATARFTLAAPVYSSGAYGVTVSIDAETGLLSADRLVAVHDAGRLLNPLIAEGQVAGATLQGFAEAVSEEVCYSPDGQLLTGSFAGYGILSAAEAPVLRSEFIATASPHSPLGVKGVGETGTTGMPAAMASAVADALAPFGVRHLDPPYTPARLHAAMTGAAAGGRP